MNPDLAAEEKVESTAEKTEPEPELGICPRLGCPQVVEKAWNYCPRCGEDLLKDDILKKLGISFTEDDLSDYLFRGYIVRDLKILGKHTMTIKSSQPQDLDEIDRVIMQGKWTKNKDGSERKVSEFYLRQMNAICVSAVSIVKIDGESIGDTIEERVKYLNERGAAFLDILSQRVTWFNRALTEYLQKEDASLGS